MYKYAINFGSGVIGHAKTLHGIDIFKTTYGNTVDLPDQSDDTDTIYIVSAIVRIAVPNCV